VNARKVEIVLMVLPALLLVRPVRADSARDFLRQGNKLYAGEEFNDAITQYDQALVENPQAPEPKFNKANSYYRLDDLAKAIDLYKEVAAESKDMKLVARAKYNLGNTFFGQGMKQRDSNLQKALEDLQTSIGYWRQTLDIEPENQNAARNIEVARLIIKDIIDQINKQKQEQDKQQNQQQDQQQQGQQQQDQQQGQDPNQPPSQQQQPQQEQEAGKEEQKKEEKQVQPPDATAQEILDNEQRQKEKRQILQSRGWQKVEKDW
jgi:Ca-activated chloride channel family protein